MIFGVCFCRVVGDTYIHCRWQSQTIMPASGAASSAGPAGARVAASSAAVELGRRLLLAARAGDTPLVLDLMAKGAPFTTDWVCDCP